MKHIFQYDFYRMTERNYSHSIKNMIRILFSPNLKFVKKLRRAQMKPSFFNRLLLKLYGRKYGNEISPDATIGKGVYLGHAYNITVADGCVLGDNVNLHKGCTIGRETRGVRKGCPTIGNLVYIGVNATVIGNIKIGNDVMIAPGSFVNFDVPDHSIVIGNPGKIISRPNATADYISNKAEV